MTTDSSSLPTDSSPSLWRRRDGTIRFSPNFSVYVLPPDGVCLYAENRKVFLRGELYCALATRIGAGERREALVSALSGDFPAAKIDEAIRRLLDRRFVVTATAMDDAASAYWTSLGLTAEAAAENLARTTVQVETFGAGGQSELAAALEAFGVRIADHSPGLSVLLVDDYLDPQLAEFNRARLTARQDWVLVQPSGLLPLIGPVFSPGKNACWQCVADRMKWNRQIKAFLDRKAARCVAASPLDKNAFATSATGLAAAEIAKAVATGFRTDLRDHVISLDVLGSALVRHHAPARPQCPACGSRELRDPARTPVPIRLRVGGKSVLTSGGYRAVAPAETLARYRKHVSALTGVLSQLERIKSDQPLDFNFHARHSFSARPETIDAPRVVLIADSYGKGSTRDQAEVSALMKAIECYCGIFHGDEIRTTRRFTDFASGDAIAPDDILLFGDAGLAPAGDDAALSGFGGPPRFDPTAATEWSPVWSLRDERFKHVSTGLLYFFHDGAGQPGLVPDSNGCAAGNTLEEAIVQAFLELVERDACAIWWYNRLRRPEFDVDRLGDSYVQDLRAQFAGMGRSLRLLDVTSDLGIPVVVAMLHWDEEERERVAFAAGAHFDLRIAVLQAVTELSQVLAVEGARRHAGGPAGEVKDNGPNGLHLRGNSYLLPHGKAVVRGRRLASFASLDRRDQVLACVKLAKRRGLDVLVLDQTRPDVQVPVVRIIVPGLRPFRRRFAPGRLYDVPVNLGLRKRPLRESELNPLDPPAR